VRHAKCEGFNDVPLHSESFGLPSLASAVLATKSPGAIGHPVIRHDSFTRRWPSRGHDGNRRCAAGRHCQTGIGTSAVLDRSGTLRVRKVRSRRSELVSPPRLSSTQRLNAQRARVRNGSRGGAPAAPLLLELLAEVLARRSRGGVRQVDTKQPRPIRKRA